jgi:hypothetical protein
MHMEPYAVDGGRRLQDALTRPLWTTAAQQGRAEFLSLWAGQGVRLAYETEAVIQQLAVEHVKVR